MSNINIHNADVTEWLKNYNGPKFHSVISDPPYGLAFMGKTWDKFTPIEYQNWVTEWASELIKHLYPGSVCMFFGGTRTYHRLATGLEDVGFEIFDSMMFLYGSGFPKALDIGKKLGGNWVGYKSCLKPAFEPIVLCRKPRGKETFVDCALNYGTGSLNVDGTRIQTTEDTRRNSIGGENGLNGSDTFKIRQRFADEQIKQVGRFPANLGLICDCEKEPCECIERELDNQSGLLKSGEIKQGQSAGRTYARNENNIRLDSGNISKSRPLQPYAIESNSGGASRFFYTAKSSRKERNLGLDHLPDSYIATMGDGIGEREHNENEPSAYVKNNHPTVKPIKLIEYLATMLKPPIEDSSILVPFSGSGSEIIGAMFAGWNIINAIEIDENYCNIAKSRVDYWKQFSTYADGLKGNRG